MLIARNKTIDKTMRRYVVYMLFGILLLLNFCEYLFFYQRDLSSRDACTERFLHDYVKGNDPTNLMNDGIQDSDKIPLLKPRRDGIEDSEKIPHLKPKEDGIEVSDTISSLKPIMDGIENSPQIHFFLNETLRMMSGNNFSACLNRVADKNRMVIVILSNGGFSPMVHNFLLHLKRIGLDKHVLIFCTDEFCVQEFSVDSRFCVMQILQHSRSGDLVRETTEAMHFRTPKYNVIVYLKWLAALAVLREGFRPWIMDTDVVVLKDPRTIVLNATFTPQGCNMYFMLETPGNLDLDANGKFLIDLDLEKTALWSNTGFMLFMEGALPFIDSIVTSMWKGQDLCRTFRDSFSFCGVDDQEFFRQYLDARTNNYQNVLYGKREGPFLSSTNCTLIPKNLLQREVEIKFDRLSPLLFQNFRVIDKYPTPVAIHFNWINGFEEKKREMQKRGYWLLP